MIKKHLLSSSITLCLFMNYCSFHTSLSGSKHYSSTEIITSDDDIEIINDSNQKNSIHTIKIVDDKDKVSIPLHTPNVKGSKVVSKKSSTLKSQEGVTFQIKYKPETFFAKNANLLNSNNKQDFVYYNRATFDVNFGFNYGAQDYGRTIASLYGTIRNQANWGNPDSIARTNRSYIKTLDYVDQGHQHSITRHILWLRELWLDFSLSSLSNTPTEFEHSFKLGAFPFELGRGIALGSAYTVAPGFLGFFSDNTINQYAYGFKFSGSLLKSVEYDFYSAILRNQMDSFAVTSENVLGQQYGHRFSPQLGTGRLDIIAAARLRWFPIKSATKSLVIEPYALYNDVPSQAVEFSNDATSKLWTIGLAAEYTDVHFEAGFDIARNFGHQTVKGWDRNQVTIENRLGSYTFVNSQVTTPVLNADGTTANRKVVFVADSPAQLLIENTDRDASMNGTTIAAEVRNPANPATTITINNSATRFRDSYKNSFKGWMATGDAGYWLLDKQLRIAVSAGYATGDENPNKDLTDLNDSQTNSTYKGFVPLQEIYSGNRVQSVFFLGGAGRAPRALSAPTKTTSDTVPTTISGFTNIVFVGSSLLWSDVSPQHSFNFRPNILAYWQQHATRAYDITAKASSIHRNASNYLGLEGNFFFDINLMAGLKLFIVPSVFIPGTHYKDIKGQPLSREQQKVLDRLDTTGMTDASPLLSNNVSYTFNIGLEYKF